MVFLVPLKCGDYLLRTADNRCAHSLLFLFHNFIVGDVIFVAIVHRRRYAFARLSSFGAIIFFRLIFFFRENGNRQTWADMRSKIYKSVAWTRTQTLWTLLSTHFKVDERRNSIVLNAVFRFYDKNERTTLTKKKRQRSYWNWVSLCDTNCT